jgi:hypothetical protein
MPTEISPRPPQDAAQKSERRIKSRNMFFIYDISKSDLFIIHYAKLLPYTLGMNKFEYTLYSIEA